MDPAAEEEYEALLQFLYLAPIGLMQARLDGEIVMVNPLCAQLLMPLSRDGQLDNLFTALAELAPDLRHRAAAMPDGHGMVCDAMQLLVPRTGRGRNAAQKILSLTLLKLDNERLMAVLGDVTESVERDRELRHSQAWLSTIVTSLTDYALVSLDGGGKILDWNASIQRVTGFDAAQTIGQPCSLFYPRDAIAGQRALDRLHDADRTGWSLEEGWRARTDGSRYWGSCLITPLHAPGETRPEERCYSLIIRDISDRRESREALYKAIACDHLTGLANRRTFFDAAELELLRWRQSPRPVALVIVDADHFKHVNDRHGHVAGDAVLRHLAAGLSATFRGEDLVARLGGEEFIVLLPNTDLAGAAAVAQRLCDHIAAQAVDVNGTHISYTVSAGVAAMDDTVAEVEELIQRADQAMYGAKAGGRNRVQTWHPALCTNPASAQAAAGLI